MSGGDWTGWLGGRTKLTLSEGDSKQSSKFRFDSGREGGAETESDGLMGKKWRGRKERGDRWRGLGLVFRRRDASPRFSAHCVVTKQTHKEAFGFFFYLSAQLGKNWATTWLLLSHEKRYF